MSKRKQKVEFRYYEMPNDEIVLALLGESWIRSYSEGIDGLHFHNYLEIGYCYDGFGALELENESIRSGPDMFSIVPPNCPHRASSDPGTKSYWEWLFIDAEQCLKNMYRDDTLFIQEILKKIYRRPLLLRASEYPVLNQIILNIIREMRKKDIYYKESVKGYVHVLIVELLRLNDQEEQKAKIKKQTSRISGALDYVKENYRDEIKISQLAQACNMSESHFRRVFLETMNMKPVDYINLIRIQKACELIQKTQISMEDVAYKVGFTAVSTFNRNFKKLVGISPYQWKQSAENFEGKLLNYRISAQKGW
ncbi:MAG: AraC family transcriptional regulator, activator of mtrCDE [Epulopiscium sp.]|jgi:AraC-like DNA-binding protein|uniref:Helix-turn-helix domain-containing protein n=1 Tax=Defluviitalea raffinosedens TaxID=1450156 RepID=A0A7C8HFS5_9FIRM|nr:AraC family transcriptional regulator [Defluviitalea raffinosedens]KAE9636183.1 helix-turn-helix domain-containing protein [Defluviitalea raffinosedens]MBM7684963.1 AraC-like DNA-binding protein [Defluviitalea raffinosedens]MBZ4666965.1 L-rhamnose operon transcriptional activator [Defluviitaleaceae bacterium]MDK2786856.1 AraC family transcriptional regulator, activator of mtrCDE [Candidatus Epulonipiscium sp.]